MFDKAALLQGSGFNSTSVKEQLIIFVLSFDSIRTAKKEGRKVFDVIVSAVGNRNYKDPTMVVEGEADEGYVSQEIYFPKGEAKQISAGNVGHFIAQEIIDNKFNKTRIGLVNI